MTKDQIFDTLERSAQQIVPDLGGSVQRTDSFDALVSIRSIWPRSSLPHWISCSWISPSMN